MPKDERRMPILMENKEFSTLADLTAENVLHVHNFSPSRLPFLFLFNYSVQQTLTSNMKKSFESNLLIKGTLCPFIFGENKETFKEAKERAA